MILIIFILSILFTPVYFAVRNHPNGICGIRVSYTMDYPDIWKRVHTLTGIISACFNIVAVTAFFTTSGFTLSFIIWGCFLAPILPGCAYAYLLGKRKDREEQQREAAQRREAEAEESKIHF